MSQANIGIQLREFMQAVNEQALTQSDFYKRLKTDIQQAIGRFRYKLDKDGEILYDDQGNPVLVENTLDDMESALMTLAARGGSRIHRININFMARIARAARYARILERGTFTVNPDDPSLAPLLQETAQRLHAAQMPPSPLPTADDTENTDDSSPEPPPDDSPVTVEVPRYPRQTDLLRELIREDILLVIKDILPDMTRVGMGITPTALKAMGAQSGSSGFDDALTI